MPPPRLVSSLEILESRIAPAALLVVPYNDGAEACTFTASKGTVADLVITPGTGGTTITLGPSFQGADLTILAGTDDTTDGITTKVAFLDAAGLDLGTVKIDGELDQISAGDGKSSSAALTSLTVGSWGAASGLGLDSKVIGAIKALSVAGNFRGSLLSVEGSDSDAPAPKHDRDGKIGSLFIGGALLGTARANGGSIFATGDIGTVTVVGAVLGFSTDTLGVTGQDHNARIFSGGKMGAVTIGTEEVNADVLGGDGKESGQIASALGIKNLTVNGSLIGGAGEDSGAVGSGGTLGFVKIAGNVVGGKGLRSGAILSSLAMQAVSIDGNLDGGDGDNSGFVASAGTMKSVTIGGHLKGGAGDFSGSVGSIKALGDVVVGFEDEVAAFFTSDAGDLIGGSGKGSGQIVSASTIKSVTVDDLVGGSDFESGTIGSLKGLGPILVKGSIYAGSGERSGLITTAEKLPAVPLPPANIDSVTVLGSIHGLLTPAASPAGPGAGGILSSGDIGPVTVGGTLEGGQNFGSGMVAARGSLGPVEVGAISGSLNPNYFRPRISAGVEIKSLTIDDSVSNADIFAGYDLDGKAINPAATIGKVIVGTGAGAGDWTGTNLIAGTTPGGDGFFGTGDDIPIAGGARGISKIAGVVIAGSVQAVPPSSGGSAHFGIVARQVVSVTVGGAGVTLNSGPSNDGVKALPVPTDTTIFEAKGRPTSGAQADLQVIQTGSPNAIAGDNVSFLITLTNAGASDAQNVALTEFLPTNTTLVSQTQMSGPVFKLGNAGTFFTDTIATLPAGSSATFQVIAAIASSVAKNTSLTPIANATAATADPNPGNNSDTVTSLVDTQADLVVTKSGPPTVIAGTSVTYVITVRNNGKSDAQNVALTDSLPANTTFVSQSQSGGPVFTLDSSGNDLSDTIATLPAGAAATFNVIASVDSSVAINTSLSDTAMANSSTTDPDPSNNASTATTTVDTRADLMVIKKGPATATPGASITYVITVTNKGESDARNVVLTDTLPPETTFVSQSQISGPAFTLTNSGNDVSDTIAALPAGASATFNVVAAADAALANNTNVSDTAMVNSGTVDPNNVNNSSTATTRITTGFRVVGAGDSTGGAVSNAGDLNNDGFDDFIVGAPAASAHGANTGAAYVIFGGADGYSSPFDPATLTGANGFIIEGEAAGDAAGSSLSAAGDVNGDGIDDLIIGAPGPLAGGTQAGAAYVIFGQDSFLQTLKLSTVSNAVGFKIQGEAPGNHFGVSVSAADLNDDGKADVIVGADLAGGSGAAYVVFGTATLYASPISASSLNGTNGFKIVGEANGDHFGGSVRGTADFNGDMIADAIIGADLASHPVSNSPVASGSAYVLFGRATFTTPLPAASLTGSNGLIIQGEQANDRFGASVSASDLNNDGLVDVIIGASNAVGQVAGTGAAYVVFGTPTAFPAPLPAGTLNGNNGFKIRGVTSGDLFGFSVNTAGDLNGDNIADLIIGGPGGSANPGKSYVIFGHTGAYTPFVSVSGLSGSDGFTIIGATGEKAGASVSAAGDIDGDNIDDLIVGAPGSSTSYVIFGHTAAFGPQFQLSSL
ncbi:MAG: hypothetical protein QOE70_328 [Chthoniobacter sp.]|jgi:uncharacterized repeat protein (TIGR01451 family)|nr:hypothetical protein [Chthoniobacter sp.]